MTNNNQGRSITPMATGEEGGGDHPLGPIRDPLADATDGLGNDPSLGELIAVRDQAPDLKIVAREAKRCNDEAQRLPYGLEQTNEDATEGAIILSYARLLRVALWPARDQRDVEAKLAARDLVRARTTDPERLGALFEIALSQGEMVAGQSTRFINIHAAG